MKDYEMKISQFVDNELDIDEQAELFEYLSRNEDARVLLNDYMHMIHECKTYYSEMKTENLVDEISIVTKDTERGNTRKSNFITYFSAAASIVLLFLLFNSYSVDHDKKESLTKLQTEYINLQKDYAKLLMEKVELVELNHKIYEENRNLQVVSYKQESENQKVVIQKTKTKKLTSPFVKRRNFFTEINTIKVTDDDFLVAKMVGN